ncbi:hypothetical protein ACFLQG_01685, partial [Candidatus Zixiibacteriota bacterium]
MICFIVAVENPLIYFSLMNQPIHNSGKHTLRGKLSNKRFIKIIFIIYSIIVGLRVYSFLTPETNQPINQVSGGLGLPIL